MVPGGTIAGIGVAIILFTLVVVVVTVVALLAIRYRNVRRKKLMERIQMDILAR